VLGCRARAPAKVILFGEHWVVHGGLALASSIGVYATVTCTPRGRGLVVRSPRLSVSEELGTGKCRKLCSLAKAARYVEEALGAHVAAECVVESDIPPGAGLGSSAAVAAAFAAAYSCLLLDGQQPPRELVNSAAYEAEKVVHGRPSGVDNTVAVHGGLLLYRRGSLMRPLLPPPGLDAALLVALTGVERSTRTAVERFSNRLALLGDEAGRLIELNDSIVAEALLALWRRDYRRLGALMNVAHGLLNGMGVSIPLLDEIVMRALSAGAYGAKLTGAGLGGAAIILAPRHRVDAIRAAMPEGVTVLDTRLAVPGVLAEPLRAAAER